MVFEGIKDQQKSLNSCGKNPSSLAIHKPATHLRAKLEHTKDTSMVYTGVDKDKKSFS